MPADQKQCRSIRRDAPVLHTEIERQCQQRIAALGFTIACDEQKQGDDDQVSHIKISWQELLQKTGTTLFCTRRLRFYWVYSWRTRRLFDF